MDVISSRAGREKTAIFSGDTNTCSRNSQIEH
jgi:hypothetical protein